ncbi:hypothetical protein C1645_737172 [Glomus cerebriforme]|uniref:Uncharacterized protein n=1 Tax=Glomus cerebriforme TaxID=658196 RepID=A0A397SZJ0_9GLOM|nr:hypothetical protein C1645_737172 [Glomus cerebriforme]
MSFQNNLLNKEPFKCEKCDEQYSVILDTEYKWCDFCKVLKNFTNWTSENKIIDDFIREKQFKEFYHRDILFEWISYDQFKNIKEINKYDETTLYSAIWENGPLYLNNKIWTRDSNEKVDLKCFYNSQNITDEFLNEVQSLLLI